MGRGAPDFLNNVEPAFPGFPNQGQQPADRYTGSLAVRSTLSPTLVNEARAGLSGGPSRFNPGASAADFTGSVANQDGFNLGGAPGNNATGIAVFGINGPTTVNAPSRRNPLFRHFSDTMTWTRGAHNLAFGGMIIDTQLTFNSHNADADHQLRCGHHRPGERHVQHDEFSGSFRHRFDQRPQPLRHPDRTRHGDQRQRPAGRGDRTVRLSRQRLRAFAPEGIRIVRAGFVARDSESDAQLRLALGGTTPLHRGQQQLHDRHS